MVATISDGDGEARSSLAGLLGSIIILARWCLCFDCYYSVLCCKRLFVVKPFVLVPKVIMFEKVKAIISLFHICTCGISSLAILILF